MVMNYSRLIAKLNVVTITLGDEFFGLKRAECVCVCCALLGFK